MLRNPLSHRISHRISPSRLFLLSLLLLATLLLTGPDPAEAQVRDRPLDPEAFATALEIGPVEGWTTTWHPAPLEIGVPVGTRIRLRMPVHARSVVTWEGARATERTSRWTVAERVVGGIQPIRVTVAARDLDQVFRQEILLHPVRPGRGGPLQGTLRIEGAPLPDDPMERYFEAGSIAPVVSDRPGHFRTSTERTLHLAVTGLPAALQPLAGLLEWRVDGEPLSPLGAAVEITPFTRGRHRLEVGPPDSPLSAELELYRVHLLDPGEEIHDGQPITLTAVTEPPGFEDEIAWEASSKFGECFPDTGTGPQFTTTFTRTRGSSRWLGIRAANDRLGRDEKVGEATVAVLDSSCEVVGDELVATVTFTDPSENQARLGHFEVREVAGTASFLYTVDGEQIFGADLADDGASCLPSWVLPTLEDLLSTGPTVPPPPPPELDWMYDLDIHETLALAYDSCGDGSVQHSICDVTEPLMESSSAVLVGVVCGGTILTGNLVPCSGTVTGWIKANDWYKEWCDV